MTRFDNLRAESYRASESLRIIERARRDMDSWHKSTYSGSNGGDCIEVAAERVIRVRDTSDRDGGTLTFSAEAWTRFTDALR